MKVDLNTYHVKVQLIPEGDYEIAIGYLNTYYVKVQ